MDDTTVNRDFFIRVYPGKQRDNDLISAQKLRELIGDTLAQKFIDRAYSEGADLTVCKLRGSKKKPKLRIDFASR